MQFALTANNILCCGIMTAVVTTFLKLFIGTEYTYNGHK